MNVILALHGFLGVPQDWNSIRQCLSSHSPQYQFEAVDYMNIRGLTPDVSLDRWGENFNLWVERQFPRRNKVIIGYSQGGRLALHALAQNPKIWSAGILMSTNPGLSTEEEKIARRQSDQKWAQRFENVDFNRIVKEWNDQAVFAKSQTEPIRHSKDYDTHVLARALTQWSVAQQKDFRIHTDLFRTQTLWMAGEHDQKYVQIVEQMEQIEKPLQTAIVEGASHRLIFDQPEKTAAYLLTFLQPPVAIFR